MASITLTIPDAQLPRVVTAICNEMNVPDSNANAKQALIDWVKGCVRSYERKVAVAAQPAIVDQDLTGIVT